MTDLRKAAELALKYFEDAYGLEDTEVAIREALRQALAQPEQEPVGYVTDSGKSAYILLGVDLEDDTPLYTAPPKKEWVGLSDDEFEGVLELNNEAFPFAVYQQLEAKLKEKNT